MTAQEIRGINHLGVTVPDLEEATRFLREGLGAKVAYDGLTGQDEPRQGEEVERQLGLPAGAKIVRQRMIVIGTGPAWRCSRSRARTSRPRAWPTTG
ncbi:Uncharacterised protein [Rothia kristinae]|uniref:VOC family protein n=1 Tax=Rothia kristinae TaxID=37923 RepID=UPI000ACB9332|nr:VOC family protein [Rothia kristinae]SQC29870.1 Uncharacterised protein [Rothia kristinae]